MPSSLEIKDTSGVENLIHFDFRDSASPNVFYDVRTYIKIQFEECIADVISMFPQNNLLFSVNLEQEKKISESNVLACFVSERRSANILFFRIYYDSILQLATCLTESDGIQLLLSLPELNFREKFLHICAVIQREGDPKTIAEFNRHLLWTGYNKDAALFIQIIQKSMVSKMPLSEMIDMHDKFLQKSYPEDIIEDIRKMAEVLIKLAQTNGNELALWALTYLFDDQDLIHDDISYLGWQDDWVVLDIAMRILHLN